MKHFPLLLLSLLLCWLSACTRDSYLTEEGIVWNTSYHIVYESDRSFAEEIMEVMNRVDGELSPFNKQSTVSLLNSCERIKGSGMLIDVVKRSREIWNSTGGYFDPSAAPLINAYGFGAKSGQFPDSAAIDTMMPYIGFNKLTLSGDSLIKGDARMEFNFSAIAKGYGCDRVAQVLAENGVKNMMVEIGGEVVLRGKNPKGGKWRISVDRPVESSGEVHESQMVVELTDCAIATSGNYRNFRERGGEKIGHIINPLTGHPAHGETVSATVVAPDCMTADAYATACMAMPRAEAQRVISKMKLSAMLIFTDGSVWMSPEFKKLVANN